jgi:hypothetical protein
MGGFVDRDPVAHRVEHRAERGVRLMLIVALELDHHGVQPIAGLRSVSPKTSRVSCSVMLTSSAVGQSCPELAVPRTR